MKVHKNKQQKNHLEPDWHNPTIKPENKINHSQCLVRARFVKFSV